jgi:hypothetical protein
MATEWKLEAPAAKEGIEKLITDEEASMEEIRVELEREQNTRNDEHRNQIEEDRDIFNETEAERNAEEFENDEEEEEEEENGQEGQEEQAERDERDTQERRAGQEEAAEDDRRMETGMIIGRMEYAANDEANDQEQDSE